MLEVDARMNLGISRRRHNSSMLSVPVRLVSTYTQGFSTLERTPARAARLITPSMRCPSSAVALISLNPSIAARSEISMREKMNCWLLPKFALRRRLKRYSFKRTS